MSRPIAVGIEGFDPPARLFWRPQVTNLLLGNSDSYTFDAAGRLVGAFVSGHNFRRGFDHRVLEKWREGGERQRRWLGEEETHIFIESAYSLARRIRQTVQSQTADATAYPQIIRALDVTAGWDGPALTVDRQRYHQVYRPVSILPPDQYLAVVLQATEGCSHNACTFCHFYRDRRFRIRPLPEFRHHITAVKDFLGSSIRLRKSIFLADANALVIPQRQLLPLMEVVHRSFPIGHPGEDHPGFSGIYSFIDAFHVENKSVAEWQSLAALGLRRVYIGMETGDASLLRFVNKPGTMEDVLEAVMRLKTAGVAVSVIIMLGIGGDCYAESHIRETVQVLNAMPLGSGDLVYFSEFVEFPETEYHDLAQAAGIHPLSRQEMRAQESAIRAELRWPDPQHPPQLSRYDVREFIY